MFMNHRKRRDAKEEQISTIEDSISVPHRIQWTWLPERAEADMILQTPRPVANAPVAVGGPTDREKRR